MIYDIIFVLNKPDIVIIKGREQGYISIVDPLALKHSVQEVFSMMTAKLFENGRSQAVRLPKEYRFDGDEVAINKIGDVVMLMPKDNKWTGFINSLSLFSDDFMSDDHSECGQMPYEERESL